MTLFPVVCIFFNNILSMLLQSRAGGTLYIPTYIVSQPLSSHIHHHTCTIVYMWRRRASQGKARLCFIHSYFLDTIAYHSIPSSMYMRTYICAPCKVLYLASVIPASGHPSLPPPLPPSPVSSAPPVVVV